MGCNSHPCALTFEKVPCVCPWRSALGAEFDVIADGEVLVLLAKENRLSFVHFKLPCQTMTWARSPPVRSCYSVWGKSGLDEPLLKQVQVDNQLLLFSMQLCVVLHDADCFFPSGILSRVGRGPLR